MKNVKRIILILLAVLVVVVPLSAFAEDIAIALFAHEYTESVELLQEGSFDMEIVEAARYVEENAGKMDDENSTRATTLEDYIYQQLYNVSEQINIGALGYVITGDDLKKVYTNVVNDHPDLFYVSSTFGWLTYDSVHAYYINPMYVMDTAEISKAKVVFERGVQRALAQVNDSMNDYQKVLTLHDYFCNIATYPGDYETNDKQIYHSAYGIFYDGKTVCAGYTLAFTYVLDRLGIDSEYVYSIEMHHSWNKVKIDGSWYNVDLTYDDNQYYDNRNNVFGSVFHRCFVKSDAYMQTADGYYHNGFVTNDDIPANNTKYDDSTFNDVSTNIYYYDNCYFSLDFDPGTSRMYFFKTDNNGNTTKLNDGGQIAYEKQTFTTVHNIPGQNTTKYCKTLDCHARLVLLDGKFYVLAKRLLEVYVPTANGWKKQNFIQESTNMFGLGVDFNGNLIYQKTNNYNYITLDKLSYFNNYLTKPNKSGYHFYADTNNDGVVNAKDYAKILHPYSFE